MDSKSTIPEPDNIIELTASIVTAYVSRNEISAEKLPSLILSVQKALGRNPEPATMPLPKILEPTVAWKDSIQGDYIICLEDGRKFRSLKRHLKAQYGMTPTQYRAKWDLPFDYPMVAPAYALKRSAIAKGLGLGVTISRRSKKNDAEQID